MTTQGDRDPARRLATDESLRKHTLQRSAIDPQLFGKVPDALARSERSANPADTRRWPSFLAEPDCAQQGAHRPSNIAARSLVVTPMNSAKRGRLVARGMRIAPDIM